MLFPAAQFFGGTWDAFKIKSLKYIVSKKQSFIRWVFADAIETAEKSYTRQLFTINQGKMFQAADSIPREQC